MTKNAETRIEELETRLAFQEDQLDQLNNSLIDAFNQVQALELAYQQLKQRVDEGDLGINEGEERPPHY